MKKYSKFLINSSIKEMRNNPELAVKFLDRVQAIANENKSKIKSQKEYVATLMQAAVNAIESDKEDLAKALLTEALTVTKADDLYLGKDTDKTDDTPITNSTLLVNKTSGLVAILFKIFNNMFKGFVPSEVAKRESEAINELKHSKSNILKALNILKDEALPKLGAIKLTDDETNSIFRKYSLPQVLKNIPEVSIED